MGQVKVNNFVKLHALVLLGQGPKHGYELIKEIGQRLDKKVSPGEIYPFLALLEEKELIKTKEEGDSAREKKTHTLTPEGRRFVKQLLTRFEDIILSAIETRLVKCEHCGCEVYEGGYEKKMNGKTMLFCCTHCAKAYSGGHVHD